MKVLVLSSNGQVGSLVAQELQARGHQVTGNSHSANRNAFITSYLKRDFGSLIAEDLQGYDAIVAAVGTLNPAAFKTVYTDGYVNLFKALAGNPTPVYIVGGAGSLLVDVATGKRNLDQDDFPAEYKALASVHSEVLRNTIQTSTDVNYIYVSPADNFDEEGELTKNVVVSGPFLTTNAVGQNYLSYKDFAWMLSNLVESKLFSKAWINLRQGD